MTVAVVLTDGQVREVVQSASGDAGFSELLLGVGRLEGLRARLGALLEDEKCSTTLLRALLVLGAFPVDGGERALVEVAREVGLAPATTHRYLYTWAELGVLVQDPRSRTYSRAAVERTRSLGGSS